MSRIISYDEKTQIAADDYLVVDSSTDGTKKIKANRTIRTYPERINTDNYAASGITDIISMASNCYYVFYTYPQNAKKITPQLVANLPSYDHAYICVLKVSPSANAYAFNKAIKDVAEMMNCSVIDINKDSGINVNNLPSHFIQESSGSYIHPLASGQALVGECVARALIRYACL